ncbi:MAG TPA: ChaN family lipoprotein, partial [Longimicrobiales bacterium]|nr:ChaN family lipoprotein [Longimicrobiales bacterium]
MRTILCCTALLFLAGCAGRTAAPGTPAALQLPQSVAVVDGQTGATLETADLLRRLAATDLVLLGEVHDNSIQHVIRGQLIAALAARRPAIVFEQFAESAGPLARLSEGENLEPWLDRSGFDRTGWKWPVHQPVVEAAIKYGRSLWGSGVSREALRSVVREGESG